ncbi:MAG: hypothetical protein ACKVQU_12280 [Burkholderiales bacterium]
MTGHYTNSMNHNGSTTRRGTTLKQVEAPLSALAVPVAVVAVDELSWLRVA